MYRMRTGPKAGSMGRVQTSAPEAAVKTSCEYLRLTSTRDVPGRLIVVRCRSTNRGTPPVRAGSGENGSSQTPGLVGGAPLSGPILVPGTVTIRPTLWLTRHLRRSAPPKHPNRSRPAEQPVVAAASWRRLTGRNGSSSGPGRASLCSRASLRRCRATRRRSCGRCRGSRTGRPSLGRRARGWAGGRAGAESCRDSLVDRLGTTPTRNVTAGRPGGGCRFSGAKG